MLAASALLAGCDQGTPIVPEADGPRPHVVWTYPTNEAVDVPHTLSIRLQFDRFLAPSTAVRQSICLQPATLRPDGGLDQCVGAGFAPVYDPVDRVAVWEIHGSLVPLTRYNVRVFAPANAQDPNGIRAFDGAPLAGEYHFAFTTARNPGQSPEPRRDVDYCASSLARLAESRADTAKVSAEHASFTIDAGPRPGGWSPPYGAGPREILANSCIGGGMCHGPGANGRGVSGAVLRFDDDGAGGGLNGVMRRLVSRGTVATETATAPADPNTPNRVALGTFARNMPYVDATNPGNSYLLYKLIAAMAPHCPEDPNEESATHAEARCRDSLRPPLIESWVPADQWKPPLAGEYERLRSRLRGEGMPYGDTLAYEDVLTMSAWIVRGAHVDDCR